MGYRSDVSISIYGPPDVMTAFIAGQRIQRDKWLVTDDMIQTIYPDKETVNTLIHAAMQQVKWYDSYEDVHWWNDFVDAARSFEAEGLNVEFVRLGEDFDDNQADYGGNNVQFFTGIWREVHAEFPVINKE